MTRMIIVFASLTAALAAAGCGGDSSKTLTVRKSADSTARLPQVEPVRGDDHAAQALEGAIARWVQWGNLHYGRTVLDTSADNSCTVKVEDLWSCAVTIKVVKPFKGLKAGPILGGYTVTRDPEKNQLIYIEGLS